MSLSKNIRFLRKQKNMSQDFLAEKLGYKSYTTIQKWEMGVSDPPVVKLKELADIFNVTLNDITTADLESGSLNIRNIFPITTKKFPLLGSIACGEPKFADENRESYIEASTDIKADFCLKAVGDSMINARINDGDIVFIREQPMVENGEIAAVIINSDEATLKRIYYYPDKEMLILRAENPAYQDLVYSNENLMEVKILGKAIAFQSDVI